MKKIARLKIKLDHVNPTVMRRIEVPLDITLYDLHMALQTIMPWENCHLFGFSTRDNNWSGGEGDPFGDSDDDGGEAAETTLQEAFDSGPKAPDPAFLNLLKSLGAEAAAEKIVADSEAASAKRAKTKTKTLTYTYDFGDSWNHKISIEKIIDPEPGAAYPRLIAGNGRCPPEDIGGSWGYEHMLEVLADPKHEDHEDMVEQAGGVFDPNEFDLEGYARKLAASAEVLVPAPASAVDAPASPKKPVKRRKTV
jgi:hypothetical protein